MLLEFAQRSPTSRFACWHWHMLVAHIGGKHMRREEKHIFPNEQL